MGQRYLIDSNVIIDYTAFQLPLPGSDFVEDIFNTDFLISVAVKIEVLGYNDLHEKMSLLEEFINTAVVLPLDESVTKQAITLRRNYKKLKLGDAIIAATALVHNLTIVTRNTSDFSQIKSLDIINPWEMIKR